MSIHPLAEQPDPQDEPQAIKARLNVLAEDNFATLKNAQSYYIVRAVLRANGRWNLILGGLTLWLGISGFGDSPLRIIQILGGLMIVGQSLWMLSTVNVSHFLRFAIVLLISGVWNIVVYVSSGGQGLAMFELGLGLAQLWWAYDTYRGYKKWLKNSPTKPNAEISHLYETIKIPLRGMRLIDDEAVIEFYLMNRYWRTWLLDNLAVVTPKRGGQILFLSRNGFYLVPQDKHPEQRRRLNGVARLDDGIRWFRMKAESYGRYALWEHAEDVDASYFTNYLMRRRELKTLARIALAIIMLIIGFFVVSFIDLAQKYG